MARLDQSFIKAYGNVGARAGGGRAGGGRGAGKQTPAVDAAAALPLLSAAPIVVDASAFGDVAAFANPAACHADCDGRHCNHAERDAERRETQVVERPSPAARPHFRRPSAEHAAADAEVASPSPRAKRRPDAKAEASAAVKVPTFDANAFSVDTFSGESASGGSAAAADDEPANRRDATARPSAVRASAARPTPPPARPAPMRPADLCHRACTVQFSTCGDSAMDDASNHDDVEVELELTEIADEFAAPPRMEANRSAAASAPVQGATYHPVSARPAATLRVGYEVDAFRWPPTVAGLAGRATTALSSLIDELVDASSSGRGVVMFAGERRGAGTTTLSAYAARRLAELGLSVALVDADFAKPTLARSLGVAVEQGWEASIEADSDFAAALIASLDDGVTMLPLRGAMPQVSGAKATRIAADLGVLRQHFALVILDGGLIAEAEAWLSQAPQDTIDCGIVVRDVREHAAHGPQRRPTAAHSPTYPAIGVVENFVRETHTY